MTRSSLVVSTSDIATTADTEERIMDKSQNIKAAKRQMVTLAGDIRPTTGRVNGATKVGK